jgi:RNA polymerase sigma-70 factor (ECF subfamily)
MVEPRDERASVQALEELYRRRYRRFLRVAIAVVGSREAAADAVQDAFARALRARHELRSRDALEAWVWRSPTGRAFSVTLRGQPRRPPERTAVRARLLT